MRRRITKRAVDTLQPKVGPDGKGRPDFLWDTELAGFGCKVSGAGRKVYIVQYRTHTQTRRDAPKRLTLGPHGTLTPDMARKLAAKTLVHVKAGSDPRKVRSKNDAPTVTSLVARYLSEHLPTKKRPPRTTTIKEYDRLLHRTILPSLGRRRVQDVTRDDIERLHTSMRDHPYEANRMLAVVRPIFNQAERWGWRPQNTNPAHHIERYPEESRGAHKEVMLTPAQMSQLFEAIDEEEQDGDPFATAAIRLAFWTGWRITSEILRLQWDNLDLDQGRARLVRTKSAHEEYRQVPNEAMNVLQTLTKLSDNPYVFPGRARGTHLTSVRGPWHRIRERAGLDNLPGLGPLRLHDLRHNVVSWDVSRGVPLKLAGKNVGHRTQQATEVYAHFAPDALKQAADERAQAMREAMTDR